MNPWTAWLYGSVARGDYDSDSDLDILVIADDDDVLPNIDGLTAVLPQSQHRSIRRYSWSEVEGMAAYGSLFLRHVHLEGRALLPGDGTARLVRILQDLGPYTETERDLSGFRVALNDVERSLIDGGEPAFELSIIATVIRHSSILASYHMGKVAFGRERSIRVTFAEFDMRDMADSALQLYSFRLQKSRGLVAPIEPSIELACAWLSIAREYLLRMEDRICIPRIAC